MPDTPVARAWEVFQVFEAHHHLMDIMNPLTSADLDAMIATIGFEDGQRVLDIACGHGEALLRIAKTHAIEGVGIDLSPWQIVRAVQRSADRELCGSLQWWLGRGEELSEEPQWDVLLCLGASWIWDGFEGTVRAMVQRATPAGLIAVGDVQRKSSASPESVAGAFGDVLTRDEQLGVLERIGLSHLVELQSSPGAWDAYQRRIAESVDAYATAHRGEQAEQFRRDQAQWTREHGEAAELINWTVWIGRVP